MDNHPDYLKSLTREQLLALWRRETDACNERRIQDARNIQEVRRSYLERKENG